MLKPMLIAALMLTATPALAKRIEATSGAKAAEAIATIDFLRRVCAAKVSVENEEELRAQMYRENARGAMIIRDASLERDVERAGDKAKVCAAIMKGYGLTP